MEEFLQSRVSLTNWKFCSSCNRKIGKKRVWFKITSVFVRLKLLGLMTNIKFNQKSRGADSQIHTWRRQRFRSTLSPEQGLVSNWVLLLLSPSASDISSHDLEVKHQDSLELLTKIFVYKIIEVARLRSAFGI